MTAQAPPVEDPVLLAPPRGRTGPSAFLADVQDIFGAMRTHGGRRIGIAFLFLLLGGLTEGLSILVLLPVLQVIVGAEGGASALDLGEVDLAGLPLPDVSVGLTTLLAAFFGLTVAQVAFNRMKATYLSDVLFDFTNGVRLSLFGALARARWDRIARYRRSDLEHALTSEVERITTCGFILLQMAQGIVMLAIYGGMSLLISPQMTGLMMLFGLAALMVMRPYRRRAARFGEMLQAARKRQFGAVTDFLTGLKAARATNGEGRFQDRFRDILETTKADARDFVRHNATGSGLFQIALTGGAAVFIYVAVEIADFGFAPLVVLLLIAMRIAPRFLALQMQMQQLLPDLAAWRQVRRMDAALRRDRDESAAEAIPVPPLMDALVLEDVSYLHDGAERAALAGTTLRIEAGRITGLIGPSGSGKSTVADLVTGLIRPSAGRILFDGRGLSAPEWRGWRDRIAYVDQDGALLNHTVRDLLALAAEGRAPEDRDLWDALEQAAADGFVRALPAGLDTVIGDRGVALSSGQRQRLAIAQAFVRRPDLLVLDEATSALDWRTQAQVAASVRALAAAGVTVLTIAHRPSMVAFADTIYALDGGRVVEAGAPEALAADANGAFAAMLRGEDG